MLNALTVDLEDWPQAVLNHRLPITDRVIANAERVLALLDRHRVRATFFALGRVCECHPRLLPMIAAEGHEIASHGYGHELVYRLNPERFAADIRRSAEIIEAQTGRRPIGYRAPAFSITSQSLWAYPILAESGFVYSSSVFPIRKHRYGIPEAPRGPYQVDGGRLIEFPLATLEVLGHRLPACGGGYLRLFPALVHAAAVRQLNASGLPAVVYLHPYELSVGEVGRFVREGLRVGPWRRLKQSLWRGRTKSRLARLLDRFEFAPLDVCRRVWLQSGLRPGTTEGIFRGQLAGPIRAMNSTDRRAVLSPARG